MRVHACVYKAMHVLLDLKLMCTSGDCASLQLHECVQLAMHVRIPLFHVTVSGCNYPSPYNGMRVQTQSVQYRWDAEKEEGVTTLQCTGLACNGALRWGY